MLCKNCNKNEAIKYSKYSNGEFCSKECAKSFSTKDKRNEINEKISKKLRGFKHSDEMKKKLSENNGTHKLEVRNKIKISIEKFYKTEKGEQCKKNLSERMHKRIVSDETRRKLGEKSKKRCESLEVRRFMGLIGMNSSSWGITGYTQTGRYHQSLYEKKCFDFLDENKIEFEEHKYLPDSSRICDIYIKKLDVWIELDGIGRKRRKDFLIKKYGEDIGDYWQLKINEYESKKLNFKIFTNLNDLKIFIKQNNCI